MMRALVVLLFLAAPVDVGASKQGEASLTTANPIRKVVTMLQSMVKKVEAEGEKEKELYEKYMCYCKTGSADLGKSIGSAGDKIPDLEASIKEGESKNKQLKEEVATHQADRTAAKNAMSEATAIRKKEAAAYEKESSESKADLAATVGAKEAIAKGLGAAFLQTPSAGVLRRVVKEQDLEDSDKQDVIAFLSGDESAPGSSEILGILKTMEDEMSKDIADEKAAEDAAIKAYDELMASKKKEENALTKAIETKMARIGELAVEIVQMKNDLEDTAEALAED